MDIARQVLSLCCGSHARPHPCRPLFLTPALPPLHLLLHSDLDKGSIIATATLVVELKFIRVRRAACAAAKGCVVGCGRLHSRDGVVGCSSAGWAVVGAAQGGGAKWSERGRALLGGRGRAGGPC